MKSLKIVFFGSSGYSLPTLEALAKAGYPIQAVVTLPERKGGRGQEVLPNPVRDWALAHKLRLIEQEKMSDPEFLKTLKALAADLFIVVSFGKFLPAPLLQIPKTFSLNVHPSLLPKFRGPSPVVRALLEGEKKTGVTILKINERIDAGDILLQEEFRLRGEEEVEGLTLELFQKGAAILLKGLSLIEEGKAAFTPQDETEATYAPKIRKSDGDIDWTQENWQIAAQVRAFQGWPGSYTFYQGRRLILWKVSPQPGAAHQRPGQILECIKGRGILVATGSGALLLEELQLEGKERMGAERFLAGHPLAVGETFACNPAHS